ncbi:MAG: pirin-like C-terminal cupin domain-containing protein, partial [Pseudomonadota bacterium]
QSMHGIQTWVALPREHAETAPDFVHHPAETLPAFDLGGAKARVLAGTAFGHTAPVEFPWGIWYVGAEADTGATFTIGADEAEERALYVAFGNAMIDGEMIDAGQMAILTDGADIPVTVTPGTRFMLAGGQTMDGPRKIDWNFVATDTDRIEKAKADWRASAASGWQNTPFTLPEGEKEFIPLPGE